jgi:hypothetical protein
MFGSKKKQPIWLSLSYYLPSSKQRQQYKRMIQETVSQIDFPLFLALVFGTIFLLFSRKLVRSLRMTKRRLRSKKNGRRVQIKRPKRGYYINSSSFEPEESEEDRTTSLDVLAVFAQTKTPPRTYAQKKAHNSTDEYLGEKENCENGRTRRHNKRRVLGTRK